MAPLHPSLLPGATSDIGARALRINILAIRWVIQEMAIPHDFLCQFVHLSVTLFLSLPLKLQSAEKDQNDDNRGE